MCHNSSVQDAQIDKFVEQGMPQKIIKTVKYTIKKRAEEHKKVPSKETCNCANKSKTTAEITLAVDLMSNQRPHVEPQQKATCPFGRGLGLIKENIEDITDIIDSKQPQQQRRPPQATSNEIYSDVLAIFTQWTRQLVVCFRGTVNDLQSSKIYTLLTKTTQPAHVIAVCILALILLTFWPEIIDSTSGSEEMSKAEESRQNQAVVIAYLGAFATHFGAQIWMTFVSGLSLYFALPRHTFGQCQKILFPKYFTLNSLLSIFMLILFVKFFLANWNFSCCVQVSVLALAAVVEVTVRLYLVPPMLLLMQEKYKIEDAVGSGQEVGGLLQGDLVKCPHYQRIHKSFRRIHMTVAIGNIVTLLCTCMHLYYLASKLSFT